MRHTKYLIAAFLGLILVSGTSKAAEQDTPAKISTEASQIQSGKRQGSSASKIERVRTEKEKSSRPQNEKIVTKDSMTSLQNIAPASGDSQSERATIYDHNAE